MLEGGEDLALALEAAHQAVPQAGPEKLFGGLTFDEIAAHLGVARSTVVRHWERARLWLYRQLSA